ncbi:MAG: hypothetical protein GYB68_00820 [Chloroflexi bacterium]|nr:hypothetical protein [Chloroflexota bacterium]
MSFRSIEGATLPRWLTNLMVALILLLSFGLRIQQLGVVEFKRDEAAISRLALDLAQGEALPLLGIPTSLGIPNTAIPVYLYALPYAISDNPLVPTIFIALLNMLAVALIYQLGRRYASLQVGLLAALLFAVSPWAVIYSRKLWANFLLPPFVVGAVLTGLMGFKEQRPWALVAHPVLAMLAIQIHYSAAIVLGPSALCLILWPAALRKGHWRFLLLGTALATLTVVPLVLGLIGTAPPTLVSLSSSTDVAASSSPPGLVLRHVWILATGGEIHSLAGPDQFRAYLAGLPPLFPLFNVLGLLLIAAVVWMFVRLFRGQSWRESIDAVLLLWLLLPIIALSGPWITPFPHYLIPLMPASLLMVARGIDALLERLPRAWGVASLSLLGLILLGQLWATSQLFSFLDQHPTADAFGVPLHYLLDAREAILSDDPQAVIVVTEDESLRFSQEPAVWDALLNPVPDRRYVNGARTWVIPDGGAVQLVLLSESITGSFGSHLLENTTLETYPQRPGEPDYAVVSSLEHTLAVEALSPTLFANGAVLTGLRSDASGLLTQWTLSGPINVNYQITAQVFDEDGVRLAQADRLSWPGPYWRAGDRLYLWFDLAMPDEAQQVYLSFYTVEGETLRNVDILDVAGNPAGQGAWVDLP